MYMNLKRSFISSLCILVMAAVGCTTKDKKDSSASTATSKPSAQARSVAQEQEASYVAEIDFQKGSSTLSSQAKAKLDETINKAKVSGRIDDVKVVTWADKVMPPGSSSSLSKADRDLADRRNKEIAKYLNDKEGMLDVDTYSMAERPNALSRLLQTDDVKMKKSLEEAGVAKTDAMGETTSNNASKSIIMVIME
ncbi:hypothetical protein QJS83_01690 [Bdellovibrio sp. 22V]|uniref:hypothetical protein n=1 Tax=Bdellovibrio TaxID=958 RepID=UPI002542D5D7|nr:hypothetical protein [Bdellovibrio sp. 22V]WII72581.1 hypothetical protein QJS83_01690 [Bdellovibrio sp. 22V]